MGNGVRVEASGWFCQDIKGGSRAEPTVDGPGRHGLEGGRAPRYLRGGPLYLHSVSHVAFGGRARRTGRPWHRRPPFFLHVPYAAPRAGERIAGFVHEKPNRREQLLD